MNSQIKGKGWFLVIVMMSLGIQLPMVFAQGMGGRPAPAVSANLPALTEHDIASMIYMREEEKMARDIYWQFDQQWGDSVPMFRNIMQSEQRHMEMVKSLLDSYLIPDPASPTVGVFNNAQIQKLYNELVAQGSSSLTAALGIGALVEEVDIADLQAGLEHTTHPAIRTVYTNLSRASENHLRAFTRYLVSQNGSYQAQVLPQETVDAILGSSRGGQGGGQGGRGWRGGR